MMKNELEKKKNDEVALVAPMSIEEFSQKWMDFQKFVNSQLKNGKDFGQVPGIQKPFLMLPGAQKILSRYLVRPEYTVTNRVEKWDKGLFNFEVKCVLCSMRDDSILGEGIGSCNSYEEKYRYNWVTKKKLGNRRALAQRERTGKYGDYIEYKVQRTDLASIHNTILKMAKKRSVIDASLTLSNASEYFTQDVEDIIDIEPEKEPVETDYVEGGKKEEDKIEKVPPYFQKYNQKDKPMGKKQYPITPGQRTTASKHNVDIGDIDDKTGFYEVKKRIADSLAKSKKKKPTRGNGKEPLIADQEAPPDEGY